MRSSGCVWPKKRGNRVVHKLAPTTVSHLQIEGIERLRANDQSVDYSIFFLLLHKRAEQSIPYNENSTVIFVQAIKIATWKKIHG